MEVEPESLESEGRGGEELVLQLGEEDEVLLRKIKGQLPLRLEGDLATYSKHLTNCSAQRMVDDTMLEDRVLFHEGVDGRVVRCEW